MKYKNDFEGNLKALVLFSDTFVSKSCIMIFYHKMKDFKMKAYDVY